MPIQFRKTTFLGLAATLDQCPSPELPEVVMSGRSNVGKSSLINALADQKHLARTSQTPGKTRHVIYFNVDNRLLLADLPGFGFARVAQSEKQRYSQLADQYLQSKRPIALVLHLLDIRHQPNQHDLQMMDWLQASGLSWQLILTKADKLSRAQTLQRQKEIADFLQIDDLAHLKIVSASKKQGIAELRALIAAELSETAAEN